MSLTDKESSSPLCDFCRLWSNTLNFAHLFTTWEGWRPTQQARPQSLSYQTEENGWSQVQSSWFSPAFMVLQELSVFLLLQSLIFRTENWAVHQSNQIQIYRDRCVMKQRTGHWWESCNLLEMRCFYLKITKSQDNKWHRPFSGA